MNVGDTPPTPPSKGGERAGRPPLVILPAIDLRGGKCVRLRQGDYAQETIFSDDPAGTARHFVTQGATWLHLVDLDGAKTGKLTNGTAIRAIVDAVEVPCQLGGGLREEEDLDTAFAWGVARLIIGTKALKDFGWLARMAERHPGKLLLGLDARNGKVATDGWLDVSERDAVTLAKECDALPLAGLIYTDISRDGMMAGPNLDALRQMAASTRLPVFASGGVTTLEDVRRLRQLNLAGCIVGRALYEGTLDLREAVKAA
jgi:phosphoribosylformimino-5-aminoimidazole carboxamide ribotide isomerase